MSAHLPVRTLRPLHRQCLLRRTESRPFSTTPRRLREPGVALAAIRNTLRYSPSVDVEEDTQLRDDKNLPDDIGMIPGTFIRKPVFANGLSLSSITRHISSGTLQVDPSRTTQSGPSRKRSPKSATAAKTAWYRKVRTRLSYELKYQFAKAKGLIALVRFRYALDNCPSLYWWNGSEVKNIAREKYVQIYRSFASGDSKAISEICLSNVAKDFRDRIAARPRGLTATWKLEANRDVAASIVSNRALVLSLPGHDGTGIQQIVLRMRSKQSLQYNAPSGDTSGKQSKYAPNKGEVLEYLVLQRQVLRGVFKEWKVWGFVNEWDMETIEEDAQHEMDLNAYQGSQAA